MKAKGLLEVTSDSVRCMDCCFIDALYQNIAFAHRRELHRMAAETMADSSRTEGAVLLLPSIIHHFMMSEDEARAESYLKVFQGFFGNFIDKFIIDMVKKYVPSAVGLDGRTQDMTGSIARKCLHALPHMRGFGKALLQQKTASMTCKAVMKFGATRSMKTRYSLPPTSPADMPIVTPRPDEDVIVGSNGLKGALRRPSTGD